MTEQEAIKRLEFLNDALNFQRADADESSCALQMAIEALEMISKRDELEDFNTLENYIAEWNKYKVFHSDDPTKELHWMHVLIRYYMVQFKLYRDSKLSPKEVLDMKVTYEQYRALGTAEEILKVLDNHKKVVAMQHETLKEYRKLGTVEELTEAKELYDVINKTEDDLCLLGMASKTEAREHIKAMAQQIIYRDLLKQRKN